jgi:hypothetical protein
LTGDVPTEISFSIFNAGNQLAPICDDGGVYGTSITINLFYAPKNNTKIFLLTPLDETVQLGVCQENDEYGAYRLDVVDGYVSQGGETREKIPGLKIQFHFGCTKDENGECQECGHIDEVWPGTEFSSLPFYLGY